MYQALAFPSLAWDSWEKFNSLGACFNSLMARGTQKSLQNILCLPGWLYFHFTTSTSTREGHSTEMDKWLVSLFPPSDRPECVRTCSLCSGHIVSSPLSQVQTVTLLWHYFVSLLQSHTWWTLTPSQPPVWQTESLASGSYCETPLILKKCKNFFCQVASDVSSETLLLCLNLVLGSELSLEPLPCYFLLVCLSMALITLLIHSLFPRNPPQFLLEPLFLSKAYQSHWKYVSKDTVECLNEARILPLRVCWPT